MEDVTKRDYDTQERRKLAEEGKALPDGSFPIVDKTDLMNALQSIGRAGNRALALRHIRARAKDLGLADALPEWAMEKAMDLKVGDFVEWDNAGGMARGRINRIVRSGKVAIPKSSFTLNAEEDNPAVLITLYREDKESGMFKRQDVTVGHKMSTLSKIEPLEKGLEAADKTVLNQLRPFSDLSDEQWLLLEDEVVKAGGLLKLSGYAMDEIQKAKRQSFGGNRSAAGAYAASVRWGRAKGGAVEAGGVGGSAGGGSPKDGVNASISKAENDIKTAREAVAAVPPRGEPYDPGAGVMGARVSAAQEGLDDADSALRDIKSKVASGSASSAAATAMEAAEKVKGRSGYIRQTAVGVGIMTTYGEALLKISDALTRVSDRFRDIAANAQRGS